MRIINDVKLDFDDVLILPKRSNIGSRAEIDLVRKFTTLNSKQEIEGIGIFASNMDATGTISMAESLANYRMFTCLHKFYSEDVLIEFFTNSPAKDYTFYSLGITDDDINKLIAVSKRVPIHKLAVDVANGYSKYFVDKLQKIRELFPNGIVLAGNVCTPGQAQEIVLSGRADCVKVGIGSGQNCLTRMVAGIGMPQLSAVIECADAAHGLGALVCSDGGCRTPGDVVKAFAAGADFVMLGGMLSATDESEGEWIDEEEWIGNRCTNKKKFKFYGMSSTEAVNKYAGGVAEYRASEGKCSLVDAKGPVKNVVQQILGGLRSACSYVGAKSLKQLSKCTTFVRVNRVHR
jgi:GMP reductase